MTEEESKQETNDAEDFSHEANYIKQRAFLSCVLEARQKICDQQEHQRLNTKGTYCGYCHRRLDIPYNKDAPIEEVRRINNIRKSDLEKGICDLDFELSQKGVNWGYVLEKGTKWEPIIEVLNSPLFR